MNITYWSTSSVRNAEYLFLRRRVERLRRAELKLADPRRAAEQQLEQCAYRNKMLPYPTMESDDAH